MSRKVKRYLAYDSLACVDGHGRPEMNSHTYDYDYIDGNAAAGELSNIFAMDVTAAEGQCAHCGAIKRFAEAHVYIQGPGLVARCSVRQHALLRFVTTRQRVFLDLRGLTCLILDRSQLVESGR